VHCGGSVRNPLRYSEGITRIMGAAKVKERQAEALFSQMAKAELIQKNLLKLWKASA
jgi:hypothetical protein